LIFNLRRSLNATEPPPDPVVIAVGRAYDVRIYVCPTLFEHPLFETVR
jgi:hypothetical protein